MSDPSSDLSLSIRTADLALVEELDLDVALDLVEAVGDDIIPEIPILKTLYAFWKAGHTVSERLLMRKVEIFLRELRNTTAEEREAFLADLDYGPRRKRMLDDLLLILDRHDAQRKTQIQGRIVRAWIKGELNDGEYLDLTHATSTMNVNAVDDLRRFYADDLEVDDTNVQLIYSWAFLQLVGIDNSKVGSYGGGKPATVKVPLGEKLVSLATDPAET
jgi:hypothetical protein